MQTKKAFTLIEVVVALGILAIVFSGTVTLVVNVVNLQLSSRNRNEAVAKAQKVMSESVALISCGCSTDLSKISEGEKDTDTSLPYTLNVTENYNYNGSLSPADAAHFAKISILVTWEDKGLGEMNYPLEQIVRLK